MGLKKDEFKYTGEENLEAMSEAKNYNDFLLSFVNHDIKDQKARILDFGAGSGTYADMLKKKGISVECLEPDSKLKDKLEKKGYKTFKDIKELRPNSYEIIYALNVFEHIEDDKVAMITLAKKLKKGGKLVIYVPAFQALFTSMDKKVGHYRRYRKNRLDDHARDAGLNVKELYYCDPLGFGAALTFKYFGNKDGVVSPSSVKFYDRFIFPASKIVQPIFKQFIGKNVVLIAEKP